MPPPKDPIKRAEYLRKQSESAKKQFADPEARKAASERTLAQMADPEKKRLIDERRREGQNRPGVRARMSASQKKRFAEDSEANRLLYEKRAEAKRTPKSRAKASESKKRVYQDHPEKREEAREKTLQQFSDPQARERHAELTKQQWDDSEKRKALIDGKHAWLETEDSLSMRQIARETLERTRQQPEYWDHMKAGMTRINSDPIVRKRKGDAARRMFANPANKAKHRASLLEAHQRPEYQEFVARSLAASKKFSKTDIEVIVESLLQALGVEYESQKHIGRWVVDFYVPSKSLVVECDGEFWHSKPEVQERDARKDSDLTRQGYDVLRLPGSQIYAGELDILRELLTG